MNQIDKDRLNAVFTGNSISDVLSELVKLYGTKEKVDNIMLGLLRFAWQQAKMLEGKNGK